MDQAEFEQLWATAHAGAAAAQEALADVFASAGRAEQVAVSGPAYVLGHHD